MSPASAPTEAYVLLLSVVVDSSPIAIKQKLLSTAHTYGKLPKNPYSSEQLLAATPHQEFERRAMTNLDIDKAVAELT